MKRRRAVSPDRRPGPRRVRVFEAVITYDPKEPTSYQYVAEIPALPGCFTDGRSRAEALRNIREVATLMLSARAGRRPRREVALIEVPV